MPYNVPTLLVSCELRNCIFSAKIKVFAKEIVDVTQIFAIARNGCYAFGFLNTQYNSI